VTTIKLFAVAHVADAFAHCRGVDVQPESVLIENAQIRFSIICMISLRFSRPTATFVNPTLKKNSHPDPPGW
jgi:hypothetical protein